ncbi:glutamic acid-rich protein-like [Helianthus annuus]|uniref:glutamic acid-rich protein-like n=1 Tax=Helianthus annuus TaxID=4232 RepID=UPI0016532A86|nr:glutamic acid-rich protein-like [Helianthus annuus]
MAKTLLVDESEEEADVEIETEIEGVAEKEQDPVSSNTEHILKDIGDELDKENITVYLVYGMYGKVTVVTEKMGDNDGSDDVDKSPTSSSEDKVDEVECAKRIQAEIEKEKQLKRKRREERQKDDDYVPSQEEMKMPTTSSKKKKVHEKKKMVSPNAAKQKLIIRLPKRYRGFPAVPSNLGVSLDDIGDFDFANTAQVKIVEKKVDEVIAENKRLAAENKKVSDREKILEMRVKRLETDNKELLKKIDTDQSEIDILKVRVAELEEEKARRDEQNKYFELKNKELEAEKAFKEHDFYMLNKVVEKMLGKSIEQQFEEIQVEELRAKRQAEIDEQMKDKGKGIEEGDDEEDDEDEKVFSASNHGSDNNNDDAQGGIGLKVTEASTEKTVDDLMNDSVNEESGGAEGKGESDDDQNVEHVEKLVLRLDTYREEGEHFHTYTLETIKEMTRVVNPDFKFDFEEELNAFDINHQPEYEYKYVEDADMYNRVEVEDWTDDEDASEDTSQLPTLMEFITEENKDELRRKVAEILKDKNFDGTPKDMEKEERKKWFKDSHERKFKRPLKYYQRDQSVSLGDITSWGFLPHVNAYAIRRECGVQYFERLYDVMPLPRWDVDELSKGYIKFESLKGFRHWKPHYPKRVRRVDPETGVEEMILNVKKPKTMKTIPVPSMEQDFYKGFLGWKDINSESKWKSSWWSLEEKVKRKAERERKKLEENRGKWMNIQAEEEKARKKENDRVRNLLRKKPKQHEEKFKSL